MGISTTYRYLLVQDYLLHLYDLDVGKHIVKQLKYISMVQQPPWCQTCPNHPPQKVHHSILKHPQPRNAGQKIGHASLIGLPMKAMKAATATPKRQELFGCREWIHENETMKFLRWKMTKPAALPLKTNFLNETCQPAWYTFHKKNKWS